MEVEIVFTKNPAHAFEVARAFLASQPVLHNLILTLLEARIAHPEPGRYWVAMKDDQVVGVVLQSPLSFDATLTPMDGQAVEAMVHAIADMGIPLPGINGEAMVAASFAGHWSERRKATVRPLMGNRLYEWLEPTEAFTTDGSLRLALQSDRTLLMEWCRGFSNEMGEAPDDVEVRLERWLSASQLWLWESGGPRSMAVSRTPTEGVVRISGVYTPAEQRNRGYAAACVHSISKHLRDAGFRCVLYTDLANPTANSIYRRIGYRVVAEGLTYRFQYLK